MIEVNLLPAEMRRIEHTPLPRFLVILLGTAAVMATGAFGVVVNWRQVPDLEGKVADVRTDVREREKTARRHDQLVAGIAETKDRKKAIAQLWHARIQWSRKWAELSEMTPMFVGYTDMKLTEARRKGRTEEIIGNWLEQGGGWGGYGHDGFFRPGLCKPFLDTRIDDDLHEGLYS